MSQRQAVSEKLKNMNQSDLDMRLLAAFRANNMDNVQLFYNHYANIHTHLIDSVRMAIHHKNDEMVEFLNSKIQKTTFHELEEMLTYAAEHENWSLAENIITQHRQNWEGSRYFYTGLAEKGNLPLLKFCHEQGLDIRGEDDYIVKCAAEKGQLDVLKFLIEEVGADPRARDDAAFGAACSAGSVETAEYMRQKGCKAKRSDNFPVWTAAFHGHLDVLKYLEGLGHSLTKCKRDDYTPLMGAIDNGHEDIVRFMAEKGVDIDTGNGEPLASAVCQNNISMVKLLIELGANVHARDYEWKKENKVSTKLKDIFARHVLRKSEEEMNKYFPEYTALACAARGPHADIFDHLIEKGANIWGNDGQAFYFATHNYYDLERANDPKFKDAEHIINTLISMAPDVIFNEKYSSIKNIYVKRTSVQDLMTAYPPEAVSYDQANMLLKTAASDYNWPLAKALIENYDVDINVDRCGLIRQALRDDPVSQHWNGNRAGNRDMLHYLIEAGADTSLIEEQQPKLLFDFNRQDIEAAQEQRALAQQEAAKKRETQRKNSLKAMGKKKPISMKKRR